MLPVIAGDGAECRFGFPANAGIGRAVLTAGKGAGDAERRSVDVVARILAGAPEFIARRSDPETDPAIINPAVYSEVNAAIEAHYRLWRGYPGVVVFQRK